MATGEPSLTDALGRQAEACRQLGSVQYADLITDLISDIERGGLTHQMLHGRPEAPLRDAVVLRYLAAVHRVVLRGDAPDLALRYPSAGGDGGRIDLADFLAVVDTFRDEVSDALGRTVQTNEVGRCTSLLPAFAEVARRHPMPLATLEIGASGGLISNWDRYGYNCFGSSAGDPLSVLQFTDNWDDHFDLSGITTVQTRRACDIAPLDVSDPEAQLRLLSFVWPDQQRRFDNLRAALMIAKDHPVRVDRGDAGDWLAEMLTRRAAGTTTIVFHSIVWQYLPRATKERVRDVLRSEGEGASAERPIAWVRLEPAGDHPDVRMTTWPGSEETVIAHSSYHGANVRRPVTPTPA